MKSVMQMSRDELARYTESLGNKVAELIPGGRTFVLIFTAAGGVTQTVGNCDPRDLPEYLRNVADSIDPSKVPAS